MKDVKKGVSFGGFTAQFQQQAFKATASHWVWGVTGVKIYSIKGV